MRENDRNWAISSEVSNRGTFNGHPFMGVHHKLLMVEVVRIRKDEDMV